MNEIAEVKEKIKEAKGVLAESIENLKNNPDDYSAKLIVVSMENHLSDLLKKLDSLEVQ